MMHLCTQECICVTQAMDMGPFQNPIQHDHRPNPAHESNKVTLPTPNHRNTLQILYLPPDQPNSNQSNSTKTLNVLKMRIKNDYLAI